MARLVVNVCSMQYPWLMNQARHMVSPPCILSFTSYLNDDRSMFHNQGERERYNEPRERNTLRNTETGKGTNGTVIQV